MRHTCHAFVAPGCAITTVPTRGDVARLGCSEAFEGFPCLGRLQGFSTKTQWARICLYGSKYTDHACDLSLSHDDPLVSSVFFLALDDSIARRQKVVEAMGVFRGYCGQENRPILFRRKDVLRNTHHRILKPFPPCVFSDAQGVHVKHPQQRRVIKPEIESDVVFKHLRPSDDQVRNEISFSIRP